MTLKIAIPTLESELTTHFGHCEKFAIARVVKGELQDIEFVTPPNHRPGVYPSFLASLGVHVIITGGMGRKALQLFDSLNIKVIAGVDGGSPAMLVRQYLNDELAPGENLCSH
jgi:predicted Fe-Mo cluster-binding NifX family protein